MSARNVAITFLSPIADGQPSLGEQQRLYRSRARTPHRALIYRAQWSLTNAVQWVYLDHEILGTDREPISGHAYGLRAAAAAAPFDTARIPATAGKPCGDALGLVTERMELDCTIERRRACQHRSDEPWLEFLELRHDVEGNLSLAEKPIAVALRLEDSLPRGQPLLDHRITRQSAARTQSQPFGSFAFCLSEVADSLLDHDSRSLFSYASARGIVLPA